MDVRAPTTGRVTDIRVRSGSRVYQDEELLLLESMKVQIPIMAPSAGIVQEIRVSAGDTVRKDDVLAVLG